MVEESKSFSNSKSSASGCCLAFAQFFCQFQPGVAYKSAAYTKKRMQHIRKPGKHGKSWFVNFSSYSHYYLQHFSKRYVCLSHNSQSIDQNYQRQRCNEA